MKHTFKFFIINLLVAALLLSGVIVLANSSKENIEEKLMSLLPFFGYSVETEEATYTSLAYIGLLPLEEKVEVQTDVDLTGTVKKFGCPPVIPMKSDWINQYGEQYNIVRVDPQKLTFFAGINGYVTIKEIIGLELAKNLPQGWELCTSDRIGALGRMLELEFLESKRIKADLQDIAHTIIEFRMMKLRMEAEENFKEGIKIPYPVVWERVLQDTATIRRGLYPLMLSELEKLEKLPLLIPFRFEIFTIAVDSEDNLKQYNIWTLELTENWFYRMDMEQTE